jgi:hypothetical protein
MKPQKTSHQRQGFFFALAFLLAGCADPASGTLTEIYKHPKDLWGEWIRMDTGKFWYITSNYMENDALYNTRLELKRQSENVIEVTEVTEVTEKKRKYYLYASRIPNGSFSGAIVGDGADRAGFGRSMTSMGGIGVTISNLNDAANAINTKTDNSGNFTATETIPGDKYEVTAGGQTTVVTPNTDGENIGTVTVTDGMNLKASIQNSSVDMMSLYTGTDYGFTIHITNTGTDDCEAATYRLTLPSGLTHISGNLGPEILGTIEPGDEKSLSITVNCSAVSGEFEHKDITVTITAEIAKKTWNDSISLKFNRARTTFYITSSSAVSGVVIVPSAKAYAFSTSGYNNYYYYYNYNTDNGHHSASVTVPRYSKDYLIVFSGATADTEAKYSLGVAVPAYSNFTGFAEPGNYEENDTEDTATRLQPGSKIMSYLHKNDIDYYRVNLGGAP